LPSFFFFFPTTFQLFFRLKTKLGTRGRVGFRLLFKIPMLCSRPNKILQNSKEFKNVEVVNDFQGWNVVRWVSFVFVRRSILFSREISITLALESFALLVWIVCISVKLGIYQRLSTKSFRYRPMINIPAIIEIDTAKSTSILTLTVPWLHNIAVKRKILQEDEGEIAWVDCLNYMLTLLQILVNRMSLSCKSALHSIPTKRGLSSFCSFPTVSKRCGFIGFLFFTRLLLPKEYVGYYT
jgi:hypothetical protein